MRNPVIRTGTELANPEGTVGAVATLQVLHRTFIAG